MALKDNLVAMLEMGSPADSHGGNTLTNVNAVGFVHGKIGDAANFDEPSSQCLTINDNAALSMGDIDFSFAVWVKIEVQATARTILAKWNDTDSSKEFRLDYLHATGKFRFLISADGVAQTALVYSIVIPTDEWHFIVCTYDATADEMAISIDAATPETTAHVGGAFDGISPLVLASADGLTPYLEGLIDDVAIWKRKISTAEIGILYNAGDGKAFSSWDAATDAEYVKSIETDVAEHVFEWVSDAAGNAIMVSSCAVSGQIDRVVIVPSASAAPTAMYSMTLKDEDDIDVLSGEGASLSETVSSVVVPGTPLKDGTTTRTVPTVVDGILTLSVTNAGVEKSGKVVVYVR